MRLLLIKSWTRDLVCTQRYKQQTHIQTQQQNNMTVIVNRRNLTFYIHLQYILHYMLLLLLWASALCIRFYNNPAPVNRSTQFHYCTESNPGTRADDAFVLKRGVWRNATWPSHSRQVIAASARHFQICFLPLYFDRLFVYLLFVYLVFFMH